MFATSDATSAAAAAPNAARYLSPGGTVGLMRRRRLQCRSRLLCRPRSRCPRQPSRPTCRRLLRSVQRNAVSAAADVEVPERAPPAFHPSSMPVEDTTAARPGPAWLNSLAPAPSMNGPDVPPAPLPWQVTSEPVPEIPPPMPPPHVLPAQTEIPLTDAPTSRGRPGNRAGPRRCRRISPQASPSLREASEVVRGRVGVVAEAMLAALPAIPVSTYSGVTSLRSRTAQPLPIAVTIAGTARLCVAGVRDQMRGVDADLGHRPRVFQLQLGVEPSWRRRGNAATRWHGSRSRVGPATSLSIRVRKSISTVPRR